MSRSRKLRERRSAEAAGNSPPQSSQHENVGTDAKKKPSKTGRKRLPTEPHPYNTERYGPPKEFRGYPTITDYLRAVLAEGSKRKNRKTCEYQWWAWSRVCTDLAKRLAVHPKFEESSPISQGTMNLLAKALVALQQDLEDNRAPWN